MQKPLRGFKQVLLIQMIEKKKQHIEQKIEQFSAQNLTLGSCSPPSCLRYWWTTLVFWESNESTWKLSCTKATIGHSSSEVGWHSCPCRGAWIAVGSFGFRRKGLGIRAEPNLKAGHCYGAWGCQGGPLAAASSMRPCFLMFKRQLCKYEW